MPSLISCLNHSYTIVGLYIISEAALLVLFPSLMSFLMWDLIKWNETCMRVK